MDLIDFLSRADERRIDGRFPRASEVTFKPMPTVHMAYQRAMKAGFLVRLERGKYELTIKGRERIQVWRNKLNTKDIK
jgi:hypothetical protein